MKFENILLTSLLESEFDRGTMLHGNLEHDRFRFSSWWIAGHLRQRCAEMPLKVALALKSDPRIIHEIGTTHGPEWWTGFVPSMYIDDKQHIDCVSMLPSKLMDKIRNKSAMVHYDQSLEAFPITDEIYDEFYKKFNEYNLPPSQFMISTSNLLEEERHNNYCKRHNITDKINILAINFFAVSTAQPEFFHGRPTDITLQEHMVYKNTNKISVFNCLNRIVREHRVAFTAMLNYYNLIEDNKVSHNVYPEVFKNRIHMFQYDNEHPAFLEENVASINSKLPLVLDTDQFEVNQAQSFYRDIYLQTWITVITETYYSEYNGTSMFFSEKIFKPMKARHPFILVGAPHSLKALREQGFKTFGDYIDESYDEIEDDTERLIAICELLNSLKDRTPMEWKLMYMQMATILEHNLKVLTTTNWVNKLYLTVDEKLNGN